MSDDALIAELHNLQETRDLLNAEVARLLAELAEMQALTTELKYQLRQYEESHWEGFGRKDDRGNED